MKLKVTYFQTGVQLALANMYVKGKEWMKVPPKLYSCSSKVWLLLDKVKFVIQKYSFLHYFCSNTGPYIPKNFTTSILQNQNIFPMHRGIHSNEQSLLISNFLISNSKPDYIGMHAWSIPQRLFSGGIKFALNKKWNKSFAMQTY